MAVDFSLLPEEEPLPDDAPSRLAWAIAYAVMALAGAFAVLYLWPKDEASQTWKFWLTLVMFPLGFPTFIVLRVLSAHEGRKVDVELRNEAVREYRQRVFQAASVPLAVVGTAHRISLEDDENSAVLIRDGVNALKAQARIDAPRGAVKARWLKVSGMPDKRGGEPQEAARHRHVTRWLLEQLLDDLAPCLRSLPARVPLRIELSIANKLTHEENFALWSSCWKETTRHQGELPEPAPSPPDLMMLDRWMDQALSNEQMHALVLVSIQLHPLLAAPPPEYSAEAGVAICLMPDELARRFSIPRRGNLHRPVQLAMESPKDGLQHALQWANTQGKCIADAWLAGLDMAQVDPLREPARTLGLTPRMLHLDQSVGHAGGAAPWLALSCAASASSSEAESQMILVGRDGVVDCAIWKPTQRTGSTPCDATTF